MAHKDPVTQEEKTTIVCVSRMGLEVLRQSGAFFYCPPDTPNRVSARECLRMFSELVCEQLNIFDFQRWLRDLGVEVESESDKEE